MRAISKLPDALSDVALIDGLTCAATGGVSLSVWHNGVFRTRNGELKPGEVPFPMPVVQQPRCTRWKLSDVRNYWVARAERGVDAQAAHTVKARAAKASAAAKTKRQAEPAEA